MPGEVTSRPPVGGVSGAGLRAGARAITTDADANSARVPAWALGGALARVAGRAGAEAGATSSSSFANGTAATTGRLAGVISDERSRASVVGDPTFTSTLVSKTLRSPSNSATRCAPTFSDARVGVRSTGTSSTCTSNPRGVVVTSSNPDDGVRGGDAAGDDGASAGAGVSRGAERSPARKRLAVRDGAGWAARTTTG